MVHHRTANEIQEDVGIGVYRNESFGAEAFYQAADGISPGKQVVFPIDRHELRVIRHRPNKACHHPEIIRGRQGVRNVIKELVH